MKKLLLVLLSLVSLFSLTSCDLIYDSETGEVSIGKIMDIFGNLFSSSSTSKCEAEGEYIIKRVEVYNYSYGTYETYYVGDYCYGSITEDTMYFNIDSNGNVEGVTDFNQYESIRFSGNVEEFSDNSDFVIRLHEPVDLGLGIDPFNEMEFIYKDYLYCFTVYTAWGEITFYLFKR